MLGGHQLRSPPSAKAEKENNEPAIPESDVVTLPERLEPPGTTFTFPADPWKHISRLPQVVLPLPVHSCYPISNDLMFPLSGPLLLVLEIIAEISTLPDS